MHETSITASHTIQCFIPSLASRKGRKLLTFEIPLKGEYFWNLPGHASALMFGQTSCFKMYVYYLKCYIEQFQINPEPKQTLRQPGQSHLHLRDEII